MLQNIRGYLEDRVREGELFFTGNTPFLQPHLDGQILLNCPEYWLEDLPVRDGVLELADVNRSGDRRQFFRWWLNLELLRNSRPVSGEEISGRKCSEDFEHVFVGSCKRISLPGDSLDDPGSGVDIGALRLSECVASVKPSGWAATTCRGQGPGK